VLRAQLSLSLASDFGDTGDLSKSSLNLVLTWGLHISLSAVTLGSLEALRSATLFRRKK